jgi:hypothetical protein
MDRTAIINAIGIQYHKPNIENGEYSYVKAAGSKKRLIELVGHKVKHVKLDIRFELEGVVILVETKPSFVKDDELQLKEYLEEERAVHNSKKIICILANTNDNKIKVWKFDIDEKHILESESVIDSMEHYKKLFEINNQNDKEKVLKNTYDLNELLHKLDIDEAKRSQFVGTCLLYIKELVKKKGADMIDDAFVKSINELWSFMSPASIIADIGKTLSDLLDGSKNKAKKIELLEKNVLGDQKVLKLTSDNWVKILDTILTDIYKYIDADSSEGQDILNLFFIAFNKYTGKADKNQAFTPDHITDFMARITEIDRNSVVLDPTCGSGSFLVQAMVKELADCHRGKTDAEAKKLKEIVTKLHIYGIENEEKAFGLATTNMLIHGDGNSNIIYESCFDCADFIKDANPDVILMNPPYNAKPISIPKKYSDKWGKVKKDKFVEYDGKEEPTKGMIFIHFLSDVIKEMNEKREKEGKAKKTVKLAVLLPVAAAIGNSKALNDEKTYMLEHNTLEAVFTLPNEIFYPGASASACCMLFTLGKPHPSDKETFFGYCKDDGFKKKKNLGRVEQFDDNNNSLWKKKEAEWTELYRKGLSVEGKSAKAVVTSKDEWLCEAFMKTDFKNLCKSNFEKIQNNYLSQLAKEGKIWDFIEVFVKRHKKVSSLEIDIKKWKEFMVSSILTIIDGSGITKEEIEYNEGELNAVQSGEGNNGVLGKIDKEYCISQNYAISEEPCLTVARSGSAGFVSYQPEGCVVGDSAKILLLPADVADEKVYLFIQTILSSIRFKYAYGRKVTREKYLNEIIKLPIVYKANGKPYKDKTHRFSEKGYVPDWEFMKTYIESLPYDDRLK